MRHEYAKSLTQFDLHVPILDAMGVEKYPVRFSDASGSFWDGSFVLKLSATSFSVFNFFHKNAKVVLEVRRSFQVLVH